MKAPVPALVDRLFRANGLETHAAPLLAGLVALAAGRPNLASQGKAAQMRYVRQWAKVEEGFRECVASRVRDRDLRKAAPLPGLRLEKGVWSFAGGGDVFAHRMVVANALQFVAHWKRPALKAFRPQDVAGVREAQRANRLPVLGESIWGVVGECVTPLEGGRVCVCWGLLGLKLYGVFEVDCYGHLEAVAWTSSKERALKAWNGSVSQ